MVQKRSIMHQLIGNLHASPYSDPNPVESPADSYYIICPETVASWVEDVSFVSSCPSDNKARLYLRLEIFLAPIPIKRLAFGISNYRIQSTLGAVPIRVIC